MTSHFSPIRLIHHRFKYKHNQTGESDNYSFLSEVVRDCLCIFPKFSTIFVFLIVLETSFWVQEVHEEIYCASDRSRISRPVKGRQDIASFQGEEEEAKDLEMSSTHNVCYGHILSSDSSRCKRRLSKSERTRRSREIFCRKGSKILPDFFPPHSPAEKTLDDQSNLPFKSTSKMKKYSWENEENGHSEAQMIAESWMLYFGLEACDTLLIRKWMIVICFQH